MASNDPSSFTNYVDFENAGYFINALNQTSITLGKGSLAWLRELRGKEFTNRFLCSTLSRETLDGVKNAVL